MRSFAGKKVPDGWEEIEPTILEFEQKMRDGNKLDLLLTYFCLAENETHEGKRKTESVWPILQINYQKSRYIYELFYKRKAITRELYQFCLDQGIADSALIAKWKKPGYERLCCLKCIQQSETSYGTCCICRVPQTSLGPERTAARECVNCGCKGCSG